MFCQVCDKNWCLVFEVSVLYVKGVWYGLTEIKSWTCNHNHYLIWDVINHPCFNGGLTKPPLKLEYGRVIASHSFTWMYWLIHAPISMLVSLITLSKRGPRCCNIGWLTISKHGDNISLNTFRLQLFSDDSSTDRWYLTRCFARFALTQHS